MKRSTATDVLAMLRVVGVLLGVALAIGAVAIGLGKAGEFVRAQPVVGLVVAAIAVVVGIVVQRSRGATAASEELVIDLTDDATANAPTAPSTSVRASAPASRR